MAPHADWAYIERRNVELEAMQGRAEVAEAALARIHENFANLLAVYTSEHSLVAVSRIRKCLDGRYP